MGGNWLVPGEWLVLGFALVNPARAQNPALSCPDGTAAGVGERGTAFYQRRHLRFGWWTLLLFVVLGVVLEALHGFKVPAYLGVSSSTRRLMWTLAHAHGTLLALVQLVFAVCHPLVRGWSPRGRDLASLCLMGASLLVPLGFFLGGIHVYGGDPGLGILLVPVGALLLVISLGLTARASGGTSAES